MGVPQTLPADFKGWDQSAGPAAAPKTLPANFDKWDESVYKDFYGTPSAEIEKALKDNPNYRWFAGNPSDPFAQHGMGPRAGLYPKDHPVFTKPEKAGDAFPVDLHLGQHTYEGAKSGAMAASAPLAIESTLPQVVGAILGGTAGSAGAEKLAKEVGIGDFGQELAGDLGGLAGGTLAAGVTDAAVSAVRQSRLGNALQNVLGLASKDIIARVPVLGHLVRRPSFTDYLAAVKGGLEKPAELVQSRALATGGAAQVADPAAALESLPRPAPTPRQLPAAFQPRAPQLTPPAGSVGNPFTDPLPRTLSSLSGEAPAPGSAGSMAASVAEPLPTPANADNAPRTFHGESVLNQVLGGRDNATLLKIARSRGINVTKEAQLKAGVANKMLVGKIIEDFSPEELQEIRDQALENQRFRHAFGDIGEEAWNTMSLQTYFPDIKIPASQLIRTQAAITNAPLKNAATETAPLTDLAAQIKKAAKPAATTKAAPKAAPKAADSIEDQLQDMLRQVKAGKKLSDLAAQ